MRSLVKWWRLPATRRALLPRALFLVIGVRVGLLVLPFGTLRRLVNLARRRVLKDRSTCTELDIVWCVSRASNMVPGATCLTQAIATEMLLASRGFAPSIQIGVRRADRSTLEGHAWVEIDGRIVADSHAHTYVPLRSINGSPAGICLGSSASST
jgi:transglutaminase superfamily protein